MPTATVTMTAVGLVLCALAFVPGRRGRAACFARGVGMLALAAAPVGIVQAVWVIEGLDFPGLVFGPLMAVPFNMGGLVCAAAWVPGGADLLLLGRSAEALAAGLITWHARPRLKPHGA